MSDNTIIEAAWTVELNCDCPSCEQHVNLLDYVDFWDGQKFEIAEHGTDRTRDVDVICPLCGHEFKVNFVY